MSGKMARRLRKSHVLSKKTLAIGLGLYLSSTTLAAEGQFLISLFPHFSKPFGEAHSIQYGLGAGAKLTYRPVKFWNLFAEGDYYSMALPGIDPMTVLNGSLGTGYHIDVSDRISLDFNINGGIYNAKSSSSITGFTAGGSVVFSYRITPAISADVSATATHYAAGKKPLMILNAGVSPGVTLNITNLFNQESNVDIKSTSLAPVFPVLYSWYENNSFGTVDITNNEDSAITNVTVSFYQPQYMAHAKECANIKKIKRGETVSVDLLAFFNEQMLELREKTDTNSVIIVNYTYLGQKRTKSIPLVVPVYGRNNMSWDDDRRAAVFVSSKDPAAMQFAKYTASVVRDNLRVDIPENIQYALGIFETLNQFGLNYVVDPSSAFEDNVGTSAIDFLQFPYQTIMYRGGDCDDISILVCSLFEAVGIDTAFITIPGHIFMAFNAGITPQEAAEVFRNMSDFIVDDGEVWVPLEITLSDEGFYRACRVGAREWNNAYANGAAALYKMRDNWKLYQPIAVPGANAFFNLPDNKTIALAFEKGADTWSRGELRNLLNDSTIQFVLKETDDSEADTVIKEDPLEPSLLKNILSLANSVALAPAVIREEELKRQEDENNDEDESIDDLLPLDLAIATIPTDVPVRANFDEMVAEQSKLIPDPEPEEEEEDSDWISPTIEATVSMADTNIGTTAASVAESTASSLPGITAVPDVPLSSSTTASLSDETAISLSDSTRQAEPAETSAAVVAESVETTDIPAVSSSDKTAVSAVSLSDTTTASESGETAESAVSLSNETAISSSDSTTVSLSGLTGQSEPAETSDNKTSPAKPADLTPVKPSHTTAIAVTAAAVTATAVAAGLIIIARKKKEDEGEK